MKPAIEIRNLGKEYTLASAQPYISLRDVIAGSMKNIFQPSKNKKEKSGDCVKLLDFSFLLRYTGYV